MTTQILEMSLSADRRSADAGYFLSRQEPDDPWAQSVRNLVGVHHFSLRRRLRELESLLDDLALAAPGDVGALRRKLSILHQEIVCSLLRAEHVAFPQILALAKTDHSQPAAVVQLRQRVLRCGCSLEAEHITALQAIWNLHRLTHQIADEQELPAAESFLRALTRFSTHFYDYLHELHVVLLERVARIGTFPEEGS